MSQHDRPPVVVVGAGIIGLSIAHHLLIDGEREVIVVDSGDVGNGTTPAGAGFVAEWSTVLPRLGASAHAIQKYSLDFYRRINESGHDIRFRDNGNIVLFNRPETLKAGLAAIASSPQASSQTRILDAAEVAELTFGAVDRTAVAGGAFMPSGIQLETGDVLTHIATAFEARGGQILRGTTYQSVQLESGQVVGVTLSSGELATDCVVLAVGAWLNDALADVGWRLPLLPFVATRFVTEDVGLSSMMPTMQAKDFPLWIRESEGGFSWGSTQGGAPAHRLGGAWTSFDRDERWRSDLIAAQEADTARVAEVFPALAGAEVIRQIQGMPVYTVDGQFFVGAVPAIDGLWAAGGDNESGVSHGPGIGRLVADLLGGREPLCDPTPMRLDRFAPDEYPDAESVGQQFVSSMPGFIADAMRTPVGGR